MAAQGKQCPLAGIATVCSAYDPYVCGQCLEASLFGIYSRALGSSMRQKLLDNKDVLKPLESSLKQSIEDIASQVQRVRDFDRLFTSRAHGYLTADNYYRQSSLSLRLHEIKIPTLFLTPLDDPLFP